MNYSHNFHSPCKDCQDRCLNCHSACNQYREFKTKISNLKQEKSHREAEERNIRLVMNKRTLARVYGYNYF